MSDSPKTVFVTASSSGIGLATARLFHSQGWNVVATLRTPSSTPPSLLDLARIEPQRIIITHLDYQDLDSIEKAVDEAIERFGRIDVAVCGGGYGQQGVFEAIPREKVKAQYDVNLFGIMDTIRALLPHLRANANNSTIITISAGASFCGFPLASLYASSKFALEGFVESLSYELASQGIAVKSVVPYSMVSETGFAGRAMGEMVVTSGREGEAMGLNPYNDFLAKMGKKYGEMLKSQAESGASGISAMDVARTILEAATDGSDKLRYWVGNGDMGFVGARLESKSDEEYIAFMRSSFK